MTATLTKTLCTGFTLSLALSLLAVMFGTACQPVASLVCLLSAGAVLYGMCLAVGWKVAVNILMGIP